MCILYNNFLRLSFDIPYMASDVVEAFFTSYSLRKIFQKPLAKLLKNETIYSYIVKIKVIPISYDSRFVYFIIFKIQNLWYFYCGVHQVWNWPSHLYRGWLRQPLNEFLKHIANCCRFILVSKEDRQRIYHLRLNQATKVYRGWYKKV